MSLKWTRELLLSQLVDRTKEINLGQVKLMCFYKGMWVFTGELEFLENLVRVAGL